jgi:hypothetical protein
VRCGYCGADNAPPAVAVNVVQLGGLRGLQIRAPLRPTTVEEIEDRFREKRLEQAGRLRQARIMAALFGGVFLLILFLVLWLTR